MIIFTVHQRRGCPCRLGQFGFNCLNMLASFANAILVLALKCTNGDDGARFCNRCTRSFAVSSTNSVVEVAGIAR